MGGLVSKTTQQEEMGFLKDRLSETGRRKETHLKVSRGIRNVAQSVECLPGFSEALVSTLGTTETRHGGTGLQPQQSGDGGVRMTSTRSSSVTR